MTAAASPGPSGAGGKDRPILRPNLGRRGGRRAVPTILQMEATECGAACLAMILAYYGRWVPLEELRVRCGVSRDGSKAVNVLRAAREYGFAAQGYRREPANLFDLPFPMIVFWNFNHFIVLEGVTGRTVHINDPGEGRRKLSLEEFDEGFTGVCLAFQPGPEFSRGGSRPNVLSSLLSRLGKARSPLFFVVAATLLLVVPGLAIPTLSKVFVDDVLIPRSDTLMTPLLIGLGVASVAQGVLTWLQQICIARMEAKLSLVASSRFFWHVVTLPMTFFGQRFAGDIANRVASNDRVAQMISGEFATNSINALTMAVYAPVMLSYDPVLTLVAFVMAALNVAALRMVSRAREDSNRRLLKEEGVLAGASVNGIRMIETLKANGAEGDFFTRWSGLHTKTLVARQKLGVLTGLLSVVPPLLTGLSAVAILGIGGLRILDGALTVGGLVAFQALARSFAAPLDGLVRFGAELQTIKGEIARLDDVLNYKADARAALGLNERTENPPPVVRGFVQLDNVTFGYNAKEAPLIENFSLSIRPSQRIALVGGSGSGKSTLGRLICGLLQPWSGTVSIDGRKVEDIPPSHFVETVAYIDQEIVLFDGSVRDNVTLWNPTVGDRDVTLALRDAAIHDDIMSRPGKYDAPVGEYGRNFSGGQRQRLEIARAFAVNPPVLVLDEATSALDPVTELEIDQRLRRRGCTCIIVAHRLSMVRDADEIVVLDRGQLVQRGRHDELIAEAGVYRDLVSSS